jgi:ACS family glucarate transporter-like MFS transporter
MAWQWIFALYAVPGLMWSFWFFAWFRDRPDEHQAINPAERDLLRAHAPTKPAMAGRASAIWDVHVVLVCAQQFFRAASNVFWFTWCPTYLQHAQDLSKEAAGELTSLPIIGVMAGSILGGLVADRVFLRTRNRRASRCGVAITATLLGVVCFGLTYLVPAGQVELAVFMLTIAAVVVSCGNSCGYSAAMDLGGRNLATVFAAMNMFGNFGAALLSQAMPAWVNSFGWPAAVLLVGGSYLCGAVCWIPLDPDRKPDPQAADYDDGPPR